MLERFCAAWDNFVAAMIASIIHALEQQQPPSSSSATTEEEDDSDMNETLMLQRKNAHRVTWLQVWLEHLAVAGNLGNGLLSLSLSFICHFLISVISSPFPQQCLSCFVLFVERNLKGGAQSEEIMTTKKNMILKRMKHHTPS